MIIQSLKNPKVIFQISDYGLLDKMAKLVVILEKNNVTFRINKYEVWNYCGGDDYLNKDIEEMKKNYANCLQRRSCVHVVYPVYDKKIFCCARSSRLYKLGKNISLDYKEITENDTPETISEKIKYICTRQYVQACNYCLEGDQRLIKVKPAIQINGELNSSEYTIVNRNMYNKLLELYSKNICYNDDIK